MLEYTQQFRESGVKWGYDVPYMLTGQYNTHPRPAISFVKDDRKDYTNFAHELLTLSTADAAYNEIKSISVCND